jgi:hypothetical protein
MGTYVDTSVILSRYVPSDPNLKIVDRFFRNYSKTKYISEISVLELHCVFARLVRGGLLVAINEARDFDDLTVQQKVKVAVEHAVRTWRLTVIIPEKDSVKFPLSKQTLEVEYEVFEALRVSPRLGLKTLDTLHLVYARSIKDIAPDLETFTTLDRDITSRRQEIQDELDIEVVSPDASSVKSSVRNQL